MLQQLRGVINGKHIELDEEAGLPDGAMVIVSIQPHQLSLDEKRKMVDELCGAWVADTSVSAIFREIEQRRVVTEPRKVDF